MARTDMITRLEVAACPMHRDDVKHYAGHEVGCDCLSDERRAGLSERLAAPSKRATPWLNPPSRPDTTRQDLTLATGGLGGRFGRGARLARTGARGVFGLASASARRAMGGQDASADVHEELAARLAEVLGEMKGAAMKLGQLLSFVDLDLPDDVRSVYHDALAKLRDSAPPFDPEAIEQVIREDFGAPPEVVFAAWDRSPLAAASIGQVHAAKLDDGRDVIVKVQYPGVAEAVRADLRNAEAFTPLARLISPNQEIEPLVEELRERVEDELDYEREAQYQRAFADRYRDHPFIHVPDIIGEMCRHRVLVTERVHGRKFDDFVATAAGRSRSRPSARSSFVMRSDRSAVSACSTVTPIPATT